MEDGGAAAEGHHVAVESEHADGVFGAGRGLDDDHGTLPVIGAGMAPGRPEDGEQQFTGAAGVERGAHGGTCA
ncbi:hypothetical protein [Streptomyces sp. NPDC001903]|uniref:hypothetical protein n=1 Tax=Streptomyces sp. NPDC001903 TaxID=3364622 RepID=UPI0036A97AC6